MENDNLDQFGSPRPISNGAQPDQNQEEGSEVADAASPTLAPQQSKRMLIGGTLLAVSILSGMALVIPHIPTPEFGAETHVAAAEVATPTVYDELELQGSGIYLYDVSTDAVLFKRNPDSQLPLASITKVILALVVADVLPMEDTVTISRAAVEKGGGGLTYGEIWRVRDLIDYMLIASSNTAAETLREAAEPKIRAKYPESSADATIWRMNALAKELGLSSTYFLNPSGLDESLTQAGALGSAKDIATLFAYALRTNRELFAGTSREFATLGALNMPKVDVHNTNNSLSKIPHIYMGKTGLTDLAGGNLAIAYDAGDNHPIIAVVLGSTPEGRFTDMEKLVMTTKTLFAPKSTE
ncbi:MAG: serine hydrolase [Minisyncoccia bacterium]